MSMTPHGVELYCPKCDYQVPPGRSGEPCVMCGYTGEGEPCSHDPRTMAGKPIGMYHCPECGEMVIAGVSH